MGEHPKLQILSNKLQNIDNLASGLSPGVLTGGHSNSNMLRFRAQGSGSFFRKQVGVFYYRPVLVKPLLGFFESKLFFFESKLPIVPWALDRRFWGLRAWPAQNLG